MSIQTTDLALHDLANEIQALVAEAEGIVIADQMSYNYATDFLKGLVSRRRKINETFDPIAKKQHDAWKETLTQKRKFMEPTETAETIIKGKVIVWDNEQERIRLEEQRRQEQEARKRDEDDRLKAAEAAQAEGCSEDLIDAILDEESVPSAVVTPPTFQRAAGVSRPRENWKGEATSLLQLVCHIAGVKQLAHPELLLLVQANTTAINQMARAQKNLCKVSGIRVWNDPNIAVR